MKFLSGFTLIEIFVVIALSLILIGIAIPTIFSFQKEADLNNAVLELISDLKLAQSKTLSSENLNSWGISFATSTLPHQYVLFEGKSYSSRVISSDQIKKLPQNIEFGNLNFNGGQEVVFEKLTGAANQFGSLSLTVKNNPQKTKTIFIDNSGAVATEEIVAFDEERSKDSRHVHFNYTRTIATSTEKIILTFEGGVKKEIPFAENIQGGEFYWQGEVDVNGAIQTVKIHSHFLNNPYTQFSVHRDRRFNNKSLDIDIDADPDYPSFSPTLLRYDAGGQTTKGNSLYVSQPLWQ